VTRVLYLYGGWPGHQPYAVADWTRKVLRDLDFDVDETTDTFRLDADLSGYDLIVLGWNNAVTTEDLSDAQEHGLLSAVESGTGVVGWHGAAAAFRSSLKYHMMLGGDFLEHPAGEGTLHPYDVTVVDRDHEIMRGVPDFSVASEQYYMHADPNNHVLATTVFDGQHLPWLDGLVSPVAWTKTWGQGRVFYHALGHEPSMLSDPAITTMTRQGLAWAARRRD
jgi:type 1 glutamine amidotransferase